MKNKLLKFKEKDNFLESQMLKLNAWKNNVFVLTTIATLVVFLKLISSIFYSDTRQETLKLVLTS